ncbi:hypothetical protein ACIBG7_18795 [Nonomuraea sp. NPDC050328]|uniref:hypothetical protein n=1 Tax=Nonomuraea sp. NPDC050328 TaxID=3364361 RepID=UPI003789DCF6
MSEHETYTWIPEGTDASDWETAIEESARDTATASFPAVQAAPIAAAGVARVDAFAISYYGEPWKPGATGNELELYAVLELADGRWASLEAWTDYSGWGCQDGSTVRVGPDRESVVRFGLTDEGRNALGLSGGDR